MTLFYTVSGLRVKMIVKFWMLATREEKEEPDFIETVCSWRNCNKEFSSQEALVKVRPIDINHGFWRRKIQRSTVY